MLQRWSVTEMGMGETGRKRGKGKDLDCRSQPGLSSFFIFKYITIGLLIALSYS